VAGCTAARRPAAALDGAALAVLAALVLASFPWSVLIDAAAFLALVIVIPVGAILAVVALVRVARVQGSGAAADVRWERHAGTVEMVLWALLALGLPAVFAGSYINGAGLFCF
jgi:Ca2+/Na+ antiporter